MQVNIRRFLTTHSSHASHTGRRGLLSRETVLSAPSTPVHSPSYPRGPYHFYNREYFIVPFETSPEAIRRALPQPLQPAPENIVLYEWINMPDSTGFGSYGESGVVIPCIAPNGERVNFTAQMYLNDEPPIAAGREIWGFPKKRAEPWCGVRQDTLTGTLSYAGQRVATGTMAYKYEEIAEAEIRKSLTSTNVNLKVIPDVDFKPKLAQLVAYNLQPMKIKGGWKGPARLNLIPNANAPVAQFPVRRVLPGKHLIADITLPYGRVMHDYLKQPHDPSHPEQDPTALTHHQILAHPSMPVSAPSYKCGPVHLNDRNIFAVVYESYPEAIDAIVPDKLRPHASNQVVVQWVTSKSTGLGDYAKVDVFVRCCPLDGEETGTVLAKQGRSSGWNPHGDFVLYHVMSFSNSSAPITFGREFGGEPQKFASPVELAVHQDTIVGRLDYCGERVATATMAYHHAPLSVQRAAAMLSAPKVTLKLLPDVDGSPAVAQLVGSHHDVTRVNWAYEGHAGIHLLSHANAPLSDLPVKHVLSGFHMNADLVLGRGHVLYDYLGKAE